VVLDELNHIKDEVDATLTYRWSCKMAVCSVGQSDAAFSLYIKPFPARPPRLCRVRNKHSLQFARGCIGHDASPFATSRNMNFWILPVAFFGIGPNTTRFGTL
jgi:hypothetical protein